ncbi:MAG TPA: haloacid dehalogenase type II [Gammaproteobacteria bacterium]|nr:haloacid dehalogenase type II [Gammaproteobacteria bacterium]
MSLQRIPKACVFDAYGTLFDVHSAVAAHRSLLGDKADAVSNCWRLKQLQYTWLRSLMGQYVDFWQVTRDGLDFALEQEQIEGDDIAETLMSAYLSLACFAEVPATLRALNADGQPCAILSNGSPTMLAAAVKNSDIHDQLQAVLSVDGIGIYKPDPRVYRLACTALNLAAQEILFMSSNAWDVCGAAHFGFQVVHINRFGQPAERLPGNPVAQLTTLEGLPALLRSVAG